MGKQKRRTGFFDRFVPETEKRKDRGFSFRMRKQFRLTPMKFAWSVLLIAAAFTLGCQQSRGFVLPEGDIEEGKAVFVNLDCNQCHSVADIIWQGEEGDVEVELGGEVTSMKTYGELVTSIINPSHKIASRYLREKVAVEDHSKMRIYNDIMTVQELTDLVAFLQSEYELAVPESPYHYPYW